MPADTVTVLTAALNLSAITVDTLAVILEKRPDDKSRVLEVAKRLHELSESLRLLTDD